MVCEIQDLILFLDNQILKSEDNNLLFGSKKIDNTPFKKKKIFKFPGVGGGGGGFEYLYTIQEAGWPAVVCNV